MFDLRLLGVVDHGQERHAERGADAAVKAKNRIADVGEAPRGNAGADFVSALPDHAQLGQELLSVRRRKFCCRQQLSNCIGVA
jgi:hypothetical protein